MSQFGHCARCGRKLRDAVFCGKCGEPFCLSSDCLFRHAVVHEAKAASEATHETIEASAQYAVRTPLQFGFLRRHMRLRPPPEEGIENLM
jgi:hypothetical protein